ncbi:family 78 glycoside hydrolase catalytic domain [Paenibacillus hodogayensis]|uniref:alpha-L-rhamnosidase n=1 Tax=Paenibacillus hodogayensis TaxID=279208 RepID=A0ABV5VZL9_9BACL
MEKKRWTARWIADRDFAELSPLDLYRKELAGGERPAHPEGLRNRHMLVRKEFELDGGWNDAWLDITGDDYYKVHINGRFVGQGPAQGNPFHYFYNRFAIADFLRQGVNTIAAHVYYHGCVSHAYFSGDSRQGLIAELTVDGRTVAVTDETWTYRNTPEYGNGATVGYDTQFLEHIDNRLKDRGWRENGFDDSRWSKARERRNDDHILVRQPTPPLSVYDVLPAKTLVLDGEGYWLDFGRELTGQLRLKARGAAGQVVEIRCGEELLDNGRVRYEMRCNCRYQEFWTLSGWDEDELELYDYKAFRYAEVLAGPGVVFDTGSFGAVVRHYPLDEEACVFESSSTLLDTVWSLCRNSVRYGSQETYVDCPSREKGQYLGDNTIIAHAHAYVSGDLRLFRKSLRDFALLAARVCPGFMAVASGSFMQEIADYSLQWPLQLQQYYRQSGDRGFVEEMLPAAESLLEHFRSYRREDGLLVNVDDKWNLVDWPEAMRDGYDCRLDYPIGGVCHNVINAFYYGAMQAVGELRAVMRGDDSEESKGELAAFRTAYVSAFYNPETGLFVDAERSKHSSLHANALPLLFGLVPQEARASVVALMRVKRLSCGVYMAYFVLQALAEAGEQELVYELIVSDDLHSWATMAREGATACFETWSKELKPNASLCHPWGSSPIPVLIEHIVGLKPAEPGWTKVSFAPHIPDSLREVRLSFRVPTGTIVFERRDGETRLTVPDGVSVVSSL